LELCCALVTKLFNMKAYRGMWCWSARVSDKLSVFMFTAKWLATNWYFFYQTSSQHTTTRCKPQNKNKSEQTFDGLKIFE